MTQPISSPQTHTVEKFAEILDVTTSCIYRWIHRGVIEAEKVDGKYIVSFSSKTTEFILQRLREHRSRPASAWVPKEITDYNGWHELLDEFVWLAKVCYSD